MKPLIMVCTWIIIILQVCVLRTRQCSIVVYKPLPIRMTSYVSAEKALSWLNRNNMSPSQTVTCRLVGGPFTACVCAVHWIVKTQLRHVEHAYM